MLKKKLSINCNGNLVDLSTSKVMGILNLSPNSFYDGGKYTILKEAVNHVNRMIKDGADFIDIGAVSSKPKSKFIPETEEKKY